MKEPKFKVGDRVEVIKDFIPWFKVGDLGTIIGSPYTNSYAVTLDVQKNSAPMSIPESYVELDLTYNSPLRRALE